MIEKKFEAPGQTKTDYQREQESEKIRAIRLEIEKNSDQQNKIIESFRISNIDNAHKRLITISKAPKPPEVTEKEREEFLKRVAENEINDKHFKKIIETIKPPAEDKNQLPGIYKKIETDERIKTIIAKIVLKDPSSKHDVIQKDIELLFKKHPNPIDFENKTDTYLTVFMKTIEGATSVNERINYQISLKHLKVLIYGKQQEYWNQIKLLKKEAKKKENEKK
ncbi:hypothetical protein KKE74_00420 [Patescibacteria group bacterium]|nr:hypothetical protein [Patescibacteria group bacterium]MBU2472479.1 hypothetical protein [Patescibacteria group bacterium]